MRPNLAPGAGSLDDGENIAFAHDQIFFVFVFDFRPGVFGEQHAIADLDIKRNALAVFPSAFAHRDDFAFLRLFLRGVREHDAACRRFLSRDGLDHNAISQRFDHGLASSFELVEGVVVSRFVSTRACLVLTAIYNNTHPENRMQEEPGEFLLPSPFPALVFHGFAGCPGLPSSPHSASRAASAASCRRCTARDSKMLSSDSIISGTNTINAEMRSGGVIMAATIRCSTTAWRRYLARRPGFRMRSLVRNRTTTGSSNASDTGNRMFSKKDTYWASPNVSTSPMLSVSTPAKRNAPGTTTK